MGIHSVGNTPVAVTEKPVALQVPVVVQTKKGVAASPTSLATAAAFLPAQKPGIVARAVTGVSNLIGKIFTGFFRVIHAILYYTPIIGRVIANADKRAEAKVAADRNVLSARAGLTKAEAQEAAARATLKTVENKRSAYNVIGRLFDAKELASAKANVESATAATRTANTRLEAAKKALAALTPSSKR